MDEIDNYIKKSFYDLAHKKFGKKSKGEINALEEALELWINQEMEKREFWSLLEDLKNSDNYKIRRKAASKLGKYDDKQAINALVKAIEKDEDNDVKRRATASLGKIGNKKAIECLIYLFDNDDKIIRTHSLNYLGDMGNLAVEPLLEHSNSKNERIRAGCIAALGRIASQNQIDIILDTLSNALDDEEDIVKWRSANALCDINVQHSIAIKKLIELLDDESMQVRKNALKALSYMGTEDAICHIMRAKQDDDPSFIDFANEAWETIEKRIKECKL